MEHHMFHNCIVVHKTESNYFFETDLFPIGQCLFLHRPSWLLLHNARRNMPRDILHTDFSPSRSWVPTNITKDLIMCPYIYGCQCKMKMWKLLETNLQQLKQIRALRLIEKKEKKKKGSNETTSSRQTICAIPILY